MFGLSLPLFHLLLDLTAFYSVCFSNALSDLCEPSDRNQAYLSLHKLGPGMQRCSVCLLLMIMVSVFLPGFSFLSNHPVIPLLISRQLDFLPSFSLQQAYISFLKIYALLNALAAENIYMVISTFNNFLDSIFYHVASLSDILNKEQISPPAEQCFFFF